MPRPAASAPPEAIRIEDEVWQEAFARRETPKRARLQAIPGGRPSPAPVASEPAAPRTAAARRQRGVTAAGEAPPVRERRPAPSVRERRPAPPVRERVPAPPAATRPEVLGATSLPDWHEGPSAGATGGVPGRRTVTIRGHGAEQSLPWPDGTRRRPQRRAYERAGFQPDRVAMWAVLLGILLVVVAVASAHG